MCSLRLVLIAILGLSASAPWLAAEEPRPGQVRLVRKIPEPGERKEVWYRGMSFSADGQRLLLTGGGAVRLYDVKSGKELARLANKDELPRRAVLSPDGQTVAATFGTGKEVLVFDTASRKVVARLPYKNRVDYFAFSPDGKSIVSSDWLYTGLDWWDTKTWKIQRHVKLQFHEPVDLVHIVNVAFSPDEKLAAVAVGDASVRLCNLKTGAEIRQFVRKEHCGTSQIAFSPDGRYLAASTRKDYEPEPGGGRYLQWFFVHLWDVDSGKIVREFRQPLPSMDDRRTPQGRSELQSMIEMEGGWESGGLAFSLDGKTLVNASQRTQLWEVATGKIRHEFDIASHSPCFSADGRLLATLEMSRTKRGEPIQPVCTYVWDWRHLCLEQPKNFGPDGIERLWKELASEDAAIAYRAIAALRAKPELAVPALAERLHRVVAAAPGEVDRLIASLDDDNFSVREKAVERLAALSETARPALLRVKAQRPSLEVRRRIEALLERFDQPAGGLEHLRCLRAMEVLETIGTPEARRVFTKLASGAEGAVETEDAKAALRRLNRK